MDIKQLEFMFQVMQFIGTGAIGVYVYISNKNRVTNERMTSMEKDIDDRMDNHGQRLARMEATVEHQPTTADMAKLSDMIAQLSAQVHGLAANVNGIHHQLKPIQESISRVNDYLLNNK